MSATIHQGPTPGLSSSVYGINAGDAGAASNALVGAGETGGSRNKPRYRNGDQSATTPRQEEVSQRLSFAKCLEEARGEGAGARRCKPRTDAVRSAPDREDGRAAQRKRG